MALLSFFLFSSFLPSPAGDGGAGLPRCSVPLTPPPSPPLLPFLHLQFLGASAAQPPDCSGATADMIDSEVKGIVEKAYRRAKDLVQVGGVGFGCDRWALGTRVVELSV